ncbi:MAG TPA: hypothetical protein VFG15_18890 [Amycolatopsis sp.]|nr:hypothetical protein [Amycolatopsis sp.]
MARPQRRTLPLPSRVPDAERITSRPGRRYVTVRRGAQFSPSRSW